MANIFDFALWQAEQAARRQYRRTELENALKNAKNIRQANSIWPACSPFLSEFNTPEYLAQHIEAREYGFGFETEILP